MKVLKDGIGTLLDKGLGPLFLVPALLVLTVLIVGPFVFMVGVSFTDLSFSNPNQQGAFIGFDNYRRLMQADPTFWDSFQTTLKFVFYAVALEFAAGLGLALLLFYAVERRRFLLTGLLVPMMLAPVAVGFMWKLLLQSEFGMFTHYFRKLGFLGAQEGLLGDVGMVLPVMIAIDVWEWTPFVTLVLLAGMMSLPREPFEAATMDGAQPWRIFLDITVPLMRPIFALVLLLRAIDAFKEFDKVFVLTGGGPGITTELLSIYTWRVNFRYWDLGYGAVVAFMVYLVVLVMCSMFYKAIYWSERKL